MKSHKLNLLILAASVALVSHAFAQGKLYYYQDAKTWEFGPRIAFTTEWTIAY